MWDKPHLTAGGSLKPLLWMMWAGRLIAGRCVSMAAASRVKNETANASVSDTNAGPSECLNNK